MSRVGNSPISFSEGTSISVLNGVVTVNGKLGELSQKIDSSISVSVNKNEVVLSRNSDEKQLGHFMGYTDL